MASLQGLAPDLVAFVGTTSKTLAPALHRHCTTHALSPPALLLGFALPSESDLIAATALLAQAIC